MRWIADVAEALSPETSRNTSPHGLGGQGPARVQGEAAGTTDSLFHRLEDGRAHLSSECHQAVPPEAEGGIGPFRPLPGS